MITILFMIYVEKLKTKQKSRHILSKKGNMKLIHMHRIVWHICVLYFELNEYTIDCSPYTGLAAQPSLAKNPIINK